MFQASLKFAQEVRKTRVLRMNEQTSGKRKSANRKIAMAIATILLSLSFLVTAKGATEQPANNAVFTRIKVTNGDGSFKELINGGSVKLSMNQTPVNLNVVFNNKNCPMDFMNESFSVEVSIEGGSLLALAQSPDTFASVGADCQISFDLTTAQSIGGMSSNIWQATAMYELNSGSANIVVKLYYTGYGGQYGWSSWLEDKKTFTLKATNNFVSLSTEQVQIEEGKSGSLLVYVGNRDNDAISDVNVTVVDSNLFVFPQNTKELNEISGLGTKTITFDVNVPSNVPIGSSQITLQVTFKDSEGILHTVNEQASITTVKANQGFPAIYYAGILAVVLIAVGVMVFVLKSRNKKA